MEFENRHQAMLYNPESDIQTQELKILSQIEIWSINFFETWHYQTKIVQITVSVEQVCHSNFT